MKIIMMAIMLALSLRMGAAAELQTPAYSAVSAGVDNKSDINEKVRVLKIGTGPEDELWDEEEITPTTVYSVSAGGLNIRNKPSATGRIMDTVSFATPIKVVALAKGFSGTTDVYYKVDSDEPLYVNVAYTLDHEPVTMDLPVKNIKQNPELPNGCEVTSLAIVMNYIGVSVDKCDLSDNYLPKKNTLNADPNEYYLREPRSNGFYCFAGPLVKCVENYNEANGLSLEAVDLTGSEPSALYQLLENGQPIVIWGTLRWNAPYKYSSGLYGNLHCMVLSGYGEATVTIQDPIYGSDYLVDREVFERVYRQMGSRAMTVYNK